MPIGINIRADLKKITRSLDNLAAKQVPFATATALTALARRVQVAEKQNIKAVMPTATPFTINSVGVIPARKNTLQATVFVKDIAAQYLEPFEFGGPHALGKKKGLLVPKNIQTNQFGNLPKSKLQQLKGRRDVFIGPVTFKKSGQTVNGVWQRPPIAQRRTGGKGTAGNTQQKTDNARSGLKLLIRFEDPLPVQQHLGWHKRADQIVRANFKREFNAAMAKALATAR